MWNRNICGQCRLAVDGNGAPFDRGDLQTDSQAFRRTVQVIHVAMVYYVAEIKDKEEDIRIKPRV